MCRPVKEDGFTGKTSRQKKFTPRILYHYKFYSETHLCFFLLFFKKNSHYELVWSINYNTF